MLENVFTTVLSMSITASVVAVLIISFRLIFSNKLPRIFSYALWAIVLLRLLIPFSITSTFSIFNIIPAPQASMTQSSQYNGTGNNTLYDTGDGSITHEIGNSFPAATPEASVDPMQVLIFVISWIWLAGAVGLFSFSIFAYFRASHRLKEAVLYKHNDLISECSQKLKLKWEVQIYTSDRIHTPVVCGLIKARIILPLDLTQGCNELELKHIITHELVHIKRFDYILKPLSMLALCVHWFNPVMWVGFILSQKDMEMSCDEKIMSVFDNDIRSEYAASLIKLAAKQNVLLNGGLLAFGESNIKSRIKGIMNFKKPGLWLGTIAVIILIAIGVVLITNGQNGEVDKKGIITTEDNRQLEAVIAEYYLRTNPNNKGILKIYNIKKYGSSYLALTEKYRGEGESGTVLFLIDNGFNITTMAPGNMPISPCFSANIVKDQGKSIVYGNFKNKKWDPKTDLVSDVQIDNIKIIFEDGIVSKEPVSMDKGYIIVADTISKIKNIEVYNNKGELQSDLSETFSTEYSFRTFEGETGYQNVQTDLYQLSIPKEWSVEKQPGSSLSFKKDGNVIGGLDIIAYYPDQPISQLQPNHSEIIESKKLEGFFTEVIQEKLKITPPAASGETTVTEQIHLFLIIKDKKTAYDLYFNTTDVDEQTVFSIAKSFSLKSTSDKLIQNFNLLQEYWLETVVINDCLSKDGPGDNYKSIGNLKYGDIVYTSAKYNEWVKCIVNNGEKEFWVKSTNLIGEQQHKDYNLGIITAKEVTVGTITLNKGNLVQVLKRDENRSCVTIRVIDVTVGKTGWIDNKDYTMAKPGVFFNQGYVKKGTVLYKEPSLKAQTIQSSGARDGTLFVYIDKEQGDWMLISSFGPVNGWVQKENVYIPIPLSEEDREKALKVVQEYFNAFAKADYKTMSTLSTDSHNKNLIHDGDVWGMKWAKAKEIKLLENPQSLSINNSESILAFEVYVNMETAKTSAQYPSTQTSFFIVLAKGEDGIWRVDRYTTG